MIGARLGPYEITAKLGEGGMGEVYRATDTKLEREVAIKVLPSGLTADKERLARFEREARLLARLHHPNIASIFGMEDDAGTRALVMELVDGPTLADRLAAGPLPVDEVVEIARQIAEALEDAHEKGIIHRDLKPQNVKTPAGEKVKVLDFGLAKAMDPMASSSSGPLTASPTLLPAPTITGAHETQLGVVLGTAAYMAPEQAKGRPVDRRADIWAFGVLLWEMLTGRHLFAGETVAETIGYVMTREPDLAALPRETPPALLDLVARCLVRDPRRRLQAIGEARLILEDVESGSSPVAAERPTTRRAVAWSVLAVIAAVAATAGVTSWLWRLRRPPAPSEPRPVLRLSLPLPKEYPLEFVGGSPLGLENTAFDVSADGSRLVYLTRTSEFTGIVAYDLDTGKAQPLDGTADAYRPVLAPDAQWVAFLAEGRLKRIPYRGGQVDDLAPAPAAYNLSLGRDGKLYWISQEGLIAARMSPVLGAPVETVLKPCACTLFREGMEPGEFIVGGKAHTNVVLRRPDGSEKPLGIATGDARVLADGTLLYTQRGRLMARRGDAETGGGAAEAKTVLDGLRTANVGYGQYVVSATGTLAYVAGGEAGLASLVRRDASGRERALPFEAAYYGAMDATPDGSRIVIASTDGSSRLRVLDVATATTQFIDAASPPLGPVFSVDRAHVDAAVRVGDGWQVVEYAIASAAPPRTLTSSPARLYPGGWSHDGRYLVLGVDEDSQSWLSIWDRGDGKVKPLTEPGKERLWAAAFSPDDRYVAYTAVGESGSEVYVMPFPAGDRRWLVSGGAGEEPVWRRDASQLVFRRGQEWYGVSYEGAAEFRFDAPRLLFRGPYLNIVGMEYRVLADGSMVLLESTSPERGADHLNVIINWLADVRRKLSTERAS
jgi:serine/threonine protein kinase